MKHFNPGIDSRLFKVDILLRRDGMFVFFEFKKPPVKFFNRKNAFVGRVYFSNGYPTFEERFDVIQRWVSSLDYSKTVDKFYNGGHRVKPIFYFGREAKIDFNVALEEAISEKLIEHSWHLLESSDD